MDVFDVTVNDETEINMVITVATEGKIKPGFKVIAYSAAAITCADVTIKPD